jgi:hypothetical protein
MPAPNIESKMTTISLVSRIEIDTTHSVKTVDAIMAGAIQEGKPIIVVPTITGEAHLVAHQIVGWWPKSSGGSRPASGARVRTGSKHR